MKKLLILCTFLGLFISATAHPVDVESAKVVASKFMVTNDLQYVTTYRTDKSIAAFYVFNTTDGFVIVAADDCETPIIAYSHEGRFNPDKIPVQMEDYLQDFVARMQYGIENQIVADETTARQWELVKTTGKLSDRKATLSVAPLLTEKWHQGCLYNSLCPEGQGPCDHFEAGCVAVAMGQIMHYWKYPTTGWGSHSYSSLGQVLSADFDNTTYDWEHMPDSLTENSNEAEIEAVATLLFHCGVSVNMSYSVNGSSAVFDRIPDALRRYFNYTRHLRYEKKKDFSNEEWMSLLKDCLDQQQPILYSGSGSGGHAFVCDGYDDNDLLHFNWGWGGPGDGYFALGNLNPLGYNFNGNNIAILGIFPQYEPCVVAATAYPSSAGTIKGDGEYHIGDSCTLTATPHEDYKFYCWKKNEQILSSSTNFTFEVKDDTAFFEAYFSLFPVSEITASCSPDANNPISPNVYLSWNHADTEWNLLKQFDIGEETGGISTDGEYIYVTYGYWNNPSYLFGKYSMDGVLLEKFNMEGIPEALCLAYDGTNFYSNSGHSGLDILYRIDLNERIILDSIDMGLWFGSLTFDPEHDGFWLGRNYNTVLYNRQGQIIQTSPTTYDYLNGTGYYTAKDGVPHLLLSRESGVYDYDIHNNFISNHPLLSMGEEINSSLGTCIARYDGKDALYIVINDVLCIYEIENTLAQIPQIIGYRIYRSDSEEHTVILADGVGGSTYIDTTWNSLSNGEYRFGISSVFANGVESEIVWSETIKKTDYGIDENDDDQEEPTVQKVFENGQIVIIKDGKRYNVAGQKLN